MTNIISNYNSLLTKLSTEFLSRVVDLPLVQSSYYVPFIIFAYLYLVLECGPRFMKNRQPYSLTTFIRLYNLIQIVANTWLIYYFIDAGLFTNSYLICRELDYSFNYTPLRLTRGIWYYFLLKILDYVETGIFVLRKKNNQITGLHLYHHVSTLTLTWLGLRYYAISAISLSCTINSFIHMLMYTYYFLATYGPNVQKAIASFKQWITRAQMAQFVILIVYVSQNFLPACHVVSHWIVLLYIGNLIINFCLFYNFYQKTYNKLKI
ncbi:hypothetical protein ACFW04_008309 [Cataglyphis niger]